MNYLSWMIYAADVVGSLSAILETIAVGAVIAGMVSIFANAARTDLANSSRGKSEQLPCLLTGWQAGKGLFKVAIVAAFLAAPIPSQSTIYAIAASEMGEEVMNSETGGKAMQALDAWLDRQIAGEHSS